MKNEVKNEWHNVRGITSEEMKQAAIEAERLYGDIIDLPRPVPRKHPPLSMEQKASQYSPFSALQGYEEIIEETARLTDGKPELDEDRKKEINKTLQQILERLKDGTVEAECVFFEKDLHKEGGHYRTVSGKVKKIDSYRKKILFLEGNEISIEDLADISELD